MKKIPTLFVRNEKWELTAEITPSCDWVKTGEGVATEKLDGANVLVVFDFEEGRYTILKRANPTKEEKKVGIQPRNIPCDKDDKGDGYLIEAVANFIEKHDYHKLNSVIYGEAIGPKIQGNRYELEERTWVPFVPPYITAIPERFNIPRTFAGLKEFFDGKPGSAHYPGKPMEGIVFHTWYASAKIKYKDFFK